MKFYSKIFVCFSFVIFLVMMEGVFALSIVMAQGGETWKTITPTDVYYLAKSVDDSLISMYGLTERLTKKRISNNLRPRNVYQKALAVAEEFDFLHDNAINGVNIRDAYNIDASKTVPADVFRVLNMLKEYLVAQNRFTESTEERTPKTPNDVFQMLRQVSLHHTEIAKKKNITTNWATPAQVYDTVVKNILPVIEDIAKETGVEYETFPFPKQSVTGIIPQYVYSLFYYVYTNISQYYTRKGGYDPIILEKMNDCDEISPADVFDLAIVIAAELKVKSGNKTLSPQANANYLKWKEGKDKIVPGDVFRLIQHNFILTRRILEKTD